MTVSFLLGNGFDRALGLETGYGAFYKWYVAEPRDGLPIWVCKFREEIDKYAHKAEDAEPYWADAEYGLGQYTEKFTLETVGAFIACYEDFRRNLIRYLKNQEELVTEDMAKAIRTIVAPQLVDFFQEIDPSERTSVSDIRYKDNATITHANFICFNYTNAVDKIFNQLKEDYLGEWRASNGNNHKMKMGKLIHAHGRLEQWPIIGVCDLSNIKNQELLQSEELKMVLQKSQSINVAGQLWRQDTITTIKNSDVICVFGMSLGDTDSDYWETLTEWLEASSQRHLVVFWYDTNAEDINLSVWQKYKAITEVKDRLFDFSSWTAEKYRKIKERIHVVIKPQKMFSIPDKHKAQQPQKQNNQQCMTEETAVV